MNITATKTRTIKCPVCGKGKVLDASKDVPPQKIVTFKPDEAEYAEWFVKCPKCGCQIGFAIKK